MSARYFLEREMNNLCLKEELLNVDVKLINSAIRLF
jgi:hypothetical protein